jgi:hypothetical protein
MKRPFVLAVILFAFACGGHDQKKAKRATEKTFVPPPVARKTAPKEKNGAIQDKGKYKEPEPATFVANANHLDRAWRLRVKSATAGDNDVTITLQFTKDVDSKDIKALRSRFADIVRVYFLDENNVSLLSDDVAGGVAISKVEGELSGKADDTFRVIAPCQGDILTMVKKVEVRPMKVPKP